MGMLLFRRTGGWRSNRDENLSRRRFCSGWLFRCTVLRRLIPRRSESKSSKCCSAEREAERFLRGSCLVLDLFG